MLGLPPRLRRIVYVSLFGILAGPSLSFGQTGQKLTGINPSVGDSFGHSVAVSGEFAIVGIDQFGSIDFITGPGVAHIYRFSGDWSEETLLSPSDGQPGDNFGFSVALDGNTAIVGAPDSHRTLDGSRGKGAAYVYRFDGISWVEETKLEAVDGVNYEQYGNSVAVHGDVVIVGTPGEKVSGQSLGAAYIYRRIEADWVFEQKLIGSEPRFGFSVALDEGIAAVGSPYHIHNDPVDGGAAYVYRFNGTTWYLEKQLLAGNREFYNRFGYSVSISGDMIAVGAPMRNLEHPTNPYAGANAGVAYIFRFDGSDWIEGQMLSASDLSTYHRFGWSVSIDHNVLVVGAPWNHDMGFKSGSAYLFQYDGSGFFETLKFQFDGDEGDRFGSAVAVSGDTVIIGTDSGGAAHAYNLSEIITATEEPALTIPKGYLLNPNFPNPFNPSTTITYTVARPSDVQLEVFDLLGKRVRTPESGFMPTGEHEVTFDATGLGSGVYFYTLTAGDFIQTRKMVVVK